MDRRAVEAMVTSACGQSGSVGTKDEGFVRRSPGRGANRWIGLDEAWAKRLGVPRNAGRYRIRTHELLARMEAPARTGNAVSYVLVEAPVRHEDHADRRLDAA
jgi:hypothetical protein